MLLHFSGHCTKGAFSTKKIITEKWDLDLQNQKYTKAKKKLHFYILPHSFENWHSVWKPRLNIFLPRCNSVKGYFHWINHSIFMLIKPNPLWVFCFVLQMRSVRNLFLLYDFLCFSAARKRVLFHLYCFNYFFS